LALRSGLFTKDSKSTSLRELWCGHTASEDVSSGQQGEQVELHINNNFLTIHYFSLSTAIDL